MAFLTMEVLERHARTRRSLATYFFLQIALLQALEMHGTPTDSRLESDTGRIR